MSQITLREIPVVNPGESLKNSLLTSAEIDANFQNLNSTKVEIENSNTILIDSNELSIDSTSGGTVDVTINGNLTVNGDQISSGENIFATLVQVLASETTTATQANGAGLEIRGDSLWASIKFDASNTRWISDIDFAANDFILTGGGSLSNTISELNSLSNVNSEITDINNDISALQTYTGGTNGTTSYTEENTVTSSESLEKGIDDLDVVSKYTIVRHESKSQNFVAESGVEYRVTPPAESFIDLTLPATKKGVVGVILTTGASGRYIRVSGSNNESIEGNTDQGDGIPGTIKTEGQAFFFRWDELSNTWRIR